MSGSAAIDACPVRLVAPLQAAAALDPGSISVRTVVLVQGCLAGTASDNMLRRLVALVH